ncbi:hypothetical protein NDU88_005181 [Pleurodeles waltl]|uniref:Uncharacterized protein n=1 Tax=Pleurodeles waltl TaxID=8319 RepID=A0AAV7TA86_PLEWA|nr:hypothetical protein NDU88_005181 [Pleurodeles waltl]
MRSKLVQIEPTPQLLPQPQQQLIPGYNPIAGPQSLPAPATVSQALGVSAPRGLGPGQTPAAISLPITVGPPVPLYAQDKPGTCDQGARAQNTIRGGFTGTPRPMSPRAQAAENLRSLLDLSPIGAPLEAMRQAGLSVLAPQTMSTETSQAPLMQSGNISLQGFSVQQMNEWLGNTNASQTTTVTAERSERDEYLNFVRLGVEAAELVEGTMGVNRLESYTMAEWRYLCPKITKEVGKVHQRLANLADKYDIDIENTKHLKRSYRLDFDSKDFDHMRSTGMKAHLKEILQSVQIWGALEKWEGRWAKKRDKEKGDDSEPKQTKAAPDTGTIKMLPMRETAGGVLVHVLWSRGDILSFTNDYPRLREKPIDWYQQMARFVKLAKCLWEDLNTLFEIIVPPDLWLECKRGVDWPTQEPARDKVTGAPSEEVQTNSDDEGDDDPLIELETKSANEEYPLITLFPMLTVTDLPAELQGTVTEKVWDLTGKEVGLTKGVEPVKVQVKLNAVFSQIPQYHMAQDVLIQVGQIIADFVKQGVLKEVMSSPCNSSIMGLKKPCGKVRIVQDLRKINEIVVECCPIVPIPAVIMFQVPCDAEWFTVVDLPQAFFSVPLHEDSQLQIPGQGVQLVQNSSRVF